MTQTHITPDKPEIKSYVVEVIKGKLCLMGSTWAVGYTKAHCSTPQEALDFALAAKRDALHQVQKDMATLMEMRHGIADL